MKYHVVNGFDREVSGGLVSVNGKILPYTKPFETDDINLAYQYKEALDSYFVDGPFRIKEIS